MHVVGAWQTESGSLTLLCGVWIHVVWGDPQWQAICVHRVGTGWVWPGQQQQQLEAPGAQLPGTAAWVALAMVARRGTDGCLLCRKVSVVHVMWGSAWAGCHR